jgi:hypothetical protein
MAINIKRIIREEMQRIIEGDVVYPKFGGGPAPREESELQQVLKKVKDMLEDMLNDEGQSMEDATVVVLNDLFDHVEELYDDASSKDDEGSDEDEEDEGSDEDEEDEEPFDGPASDRERDELKGFNDFMKNRDRKGDY